MERRQEIGHQDLLERQAQIAKTLGVSRDFDAAAEAERRIAFLADYLKQNALRTLVLGISGGVDSLAAGLLAQRAVERLRKGGSEAEFIAVRLPYGNQADEADARKCLEVIGPDRVGSIDIRPATDAMMEEVMRDAADLLEGERFHFHLGNIKARQRMIAQYALAGASRGIVIGTDHAAEALMGFYTKFGDGAADILPLAGLNKRRVRAVARHLGAPDDLVEKVPTADLESDAPLKPDEAVYGVTYEEIDDFLEGKSISDESLGKILTSHQVSAHKRELPVVP
ncbi:NH(3)-dependent NAD(+) synthetase [Pseudorhizobium banfieldiae]|uniref:NH(3)-dependent NAD(+) synthetase n=1 Tax=Pseudorhizobium banfieldiae TaxID=1125847 RepID=L0NDP8_9HYPH|nr:ammonia-dependent NAD(+) synthetase [Pseudorhizobium banfieldiae]CAD6604610.1 ammonia-dependent NAD(+) synthetase [arsenite-oxidising bacterium NT-25]CCF18941.1 NH(3)-dependent NAD(+) synthetase [Pseudorhizobium banfieldiae]